MTVEKGLGALIFQKASWTSRLSNQAWKVSKDILGQDAAVVGHWEAGTQHRMPPLLAEGKA
jgi:hypothetical protein